MRLRIGLISDTHGLLRPEAVEFLRGSDHIIHGGDIGNAAILDALAAIAPVTAVRGNNDRGAWAAALPSTQFVQLGGALIHVLHDLAELDIDPAAAAVQVIVSGHSHKPNVSHQAGVIYINPGSAGPRRFRLPIAVGELLIADGVITPRTVELTCQ
jgi:putative phosphoesterase